MNFQAEKCTTRQVVGVNKFGSVPKFVAKFLNLLDADYSTGHALRRFSATILVDSGADLLTLKPHGGWKSSTVAEGYINDSINKKLETSKQIVGSIMESSLPARSLASNQEENLLINDESLAKAPMILNNCTNITINLIKNNN